MILVADSGSTKCDWLAFDQQNAYDKVSTMGFNPFFHSTELIIGELLKSEGLIAYREKITHIYYFGAGCSSKERNEIVSKALNVVFPNAEVMVDHDLLGAAYAACGDNEGIACILGTGSNSCYFDGTKIYEEVPALGYILGDEGGGDNMGRQLLTKYLYKQLPDNLHNYIKNELGLNKEIIFDKVYNQPNANVFMASMMKSLSEFRDTDYVQNFVAENLHNFLSIHVCCFEKHKEVPVNFVGSIAHYYFDVLKKEGEKLGININDVKKKPIYALKDYYYSKHFN